MPSASARWTAPGGECWGMAVSQIATVFKLNRQGFNLRRGSAVLVMLVPLVILGLLDQEKYWASVAFGALFVGLTRCLWSSSRWDDALGARSWDPWPACGRFGASENDATGSSFAAVRWCNYSSTTARPVGGWTAWKR